MRVLFDHQIFSSQNIGGASRYFAELYYGLNNINPNENELAFLFSNNVYLKEKQLAIRPFFNGYNFPKKGKILYYINQRYSENKFRKEKYDLAHITYYDPYFLNHIGKKPFVITFLDMIHERFDSTFPELGNNVRLINNKKLLADRASHIIAISEQTKRDMIDIYGTDPNKITVIHLGNSFVKSNDNKLLLKEKTPDPYILYVGTRHAYKNFPFFVESIADLLKKYSLQLICAGGGKFTEKEKDLFQTLDISNLVFYKSGSDQLLGELYSQALAFVFPSYYEGFGLPVLEAFACQCPCVISNGGSLPEVAGEAAIYFQPDDSDSIYNAVLKIIDDKELRENLIIKGNTEIKRFSWQKTIEKTDALYRKM